MKKFMNLENLDGVDIVLFVIHTDPHVENGSALGKNARIIDWSDGKRTDHRLFFMRLKKEKRLSR